MKGKVKENKKTVSISNKKTSNTVTMENTDENPERKNKKRGCNIVCCFFPNLSEIDCCNSCACKVHCP
jgi:hypothetical protein